MKNPVPLLDYMIVHRLKRKPDAKDLTINVEAEILRSGHSKTSSFSFSSHEFVKEEYNSLNKEKLFYFLIEAGIEECNDAQFMINDMISSVRELPCLKRHWVRGVLTVSLYVRFPSIEPSQSDAWSTSAQEWSKC